MNELEKYLKQTDGVASFVSNTVRLDRPINYINVEFVLCKG